MIDSRLTTRRPMTSPLLPVRKATAAGTRGALALLLALAATAGCASADGSNEDLLGVDEPVGSESEAATTNGWTPFTHGQGAFCSRGSLVDGLQRDGHTIRAHCRAASSTTTGNEWISDGTLCPSGKVATGVKCNSGGNCGNPSILCGTPSSMIIGSGSSVAMNGSDSVIFSSGNYLRRTSCDETNCTLSVYSVQPIINP